MHKPVDHLWPRRRSESGSRAEAGAIEAAVADKRPVLLESDTESKRLVDEIQQIVFADRVGRHVPYPREARMPFQDVVDNISERIRGQAAKDGAAIPLGGATLPSDKPFEYAQA